MEFIVPLSEAEHDNCEILTIVDNLSKLIRYIPIKSTTDAPETACKLKEHLYRNHDIPKKIISDRDPIFMSKF